LGQKESRQPDVGAQVDDGTGIGQDGMRHSITFVSENLVKNEEVAGTSPKPQVKPITAKFDSMSFRLFGGFGTAPPQQVGKVKLPGSPDQSEKRKRTCGYPCASARFVQVLPDPGCHVRRGTPLRNESGRGT
jgi:hypothetical protein